MLAGRQLNNLVVVSALNWLLQCDVVWNSGGELIGHDDGVLLSFGCFPRRQLERNCSILFGATKDFKRQCCSYDAISYRCVFTLKEQTAY